MSDNIHVLQTGLTNTDLGDQGLGGLVELSHLYETAPVGLCLMDAELRYIRINQCLAAIHGIAADDHLGKRIDEVIPDIASNVVPIYQQVIETGEPVVDYQITAPSPTDPERRTTWLTNFHPVVNKGVVVGVSTVVQEITQRVEAEDALRESQMRYDMATRAGSTGIWEWDLKTHEIYFDPVLTALLGLESGEIKSSDDWRKYAHPDDIELFGKQARLHVKGLIPQLRIAHRMIHGDGGQRWFLARGVADRDENGWATKIIGTATCITDLKNAQGQLEESEQKLQSIFTHALDGIMLIDAHTARIVDCNPEFERQTGRSLQELRRKQVWQLLTPKQRITGKEKFWEIDQIGKGRESAFDFQRPDGVVVPVEFHTTCISIDGKEYHQSISRDMTDRREAEMALVASEQKYRDLYNNAPDLCLSLDMKESVVRDCNCRMLNQSGFGSCDIFGRKIPDLFHKDDAENIQKALTKFTRDGELRDLELRFLTSADAHIFVSVNMTAVRDETGNISLGLATLRDISAQKEAEAELKSAFKEISTLKNQLEKENVYLKSEIELTQSHSEIIGESEAIRNVLAQIEQVAHTDATVLISGETGTGKDLLASAIHNLSKRNGRSLVKVNCAALPGTLIESELFGREKGAYTGADSKQLGRFEVADKSSIFLDEISEMSLELQAKLLRVLQDGEFERLGSGRTVKTDARVIAATNRDMQQLVSEGRFREDLFYRLNVFPILVPPLRDRVADVPMLVWTFVRQFGESMGKHIERIPRRCMSTLAGYHWPGNIRELRNVIERAMIINNGPVLEIAIPAMQSGQNSTMKSLADAEREHILSVLERTRWRIRGESGAAEILGMKPTTLESRMVKLGIHR